MDDINDILKSYNKSVYNQWQQKDSPLWLLELSRSLVKEPTLPIHMKSILDYTDKRVGVIQEFDSPKFMETIHPSHHAFFDILRKEASAYYSVFQDGHRKNIYAQELINQVKEIHGEKSVEKFIYNQNSMYDSIGNMVVAVAVNAICDMSLVEYLHLHGKINDKEKEFGLNEINNRLDRVGINGIDRMFKAAPKFEHFIKKDMTIIKTPNPLGVLNQEYTRAAYYNEKMDKVKNLGDDSKAIAMQEVISPTFPKLEKEKDNYILIQVRNLPPLSPEARKKYAIVHLNDNLATPAELREKKRVGDKIDADLKRRDESSDIESHRVALYDEIAINHPQRDVYADALRKRMKIAMEGEIIPADGKSGSIIGKHTKSVSDSKSGVIEGKVISSEISSEPIATDSKKKVSSQQSSEGLASNADASSSIGAKIATLGGAAAVGLLLASGGNDKANSAGYENDKEDNKGSKSLKFAALAAASAVAAGGAIVWTKKPEFLYKPMQNLINSFGHSRA